MDQELDHLLGRVLGTGRQGVRLDLEASEMAIRASRHQRGGVLLEKVLNADGGGYRGAQVDCGRGHAAQFIDYRPKQLLTVLSPVEVERAYYHCGACGGGVIPKDRELDIEGTSVSPGVRRMKGRVGSKEAFAEGRRDLEELAGVVVTTQQVERVAETLGEQVEAAGRDERKQILCGKVIPLRSVPKLYMAMDATGVPMVRRERQGRAGKGENGEAKGRDAKVGCVFTQTGLDEQKRPVRDEASTTYVGAIEKAEGFGWRIYTEALRRGLRRAEQVIVLGDGASWIWGLAEEHFPSAVQIVDLYHAREHLARISKVVYGEGTVAAKGWAAARSKQLDAGRVEAVVRALKKLHPRGSEARHEVRKAIAYFQTNAHRMRYAEFRRQGFFVGSGVVEAGCKTLIGLRLKQSGMQWTVRGANAIIALRCCELSGRWEEFWENRAVNQ
jgi:Uncharacterised protein family (UPF0236)